MVVISGVELVTGDRLLWAAQRGSERLRLIADAGVSVRRVGERVYVAHALPMPATRTVRLMPTTKYVSPTTCASTISTDSACCRRTRRCGVTPSAGIMNAAMRLRK